MFNLGAVLRAFFNMDDLINWRKSVVLKKARRYGMAPIRMFLHQWGIKGDTEEIPPIFANSFPKSGTNLLLQILQAFPRLRDWGLFLASTPSFTFREIQGPGMANKIRWIVARELVGAHLHYSEEVRRELSDRGTVHYFIYRDLRDVVVSDAYYLSAMNRWHRLHKYFRALPSMEDRVRLAIKGFEHSNAPFKFEDIGSRFERYKPWIRSKDVCAVRYEDLCSERRKYWIHRIIKFYADRTGDSLEFGTSVEKALANINPKSSPTFRQGRIGEWKELFTSEHKDLFKRYAGGLLIELDYEKDLTW